MYRRDQGLVTPDLYYPTGGERQRSLRYQDYGNGTKRKSRRSRLGAGRESRICRMQGALVVWFALLVAFVLGLFFGCCLG